MIKVDKRTAKVVIKCEGDMPPMPVTCGSMLNNKTSSWRNLKPIIDEDKCISCMICWKFCPDVAVKIVDDKPVIDYDYCKGCGICYQECPVKAICMEVEHK